MNLDYFQTIRNDFFTAMEVVEGDKGSNFKLVRYVRGEDKERVLVLIPDVIR